MKNAHKVLPLSIIMTIVAILLLTACSSTVASGSSNKSSLTPGQVISKSADAMKQLKSSHFDVKTTSSVQMAGTSASKTTNGQSVTSPSGTPVAINQNVNLTGSGDQTGSDNQYSYTVSAAQQSLKMAEVVQGNKLYIQNQTGKWYVIDKDKVANMASSNFSGVTIDQNSLLAAIQDVKLIDHNDENVDGQSLRHLTAVLDKNALVQLLNANPQLKSQFGQQNVNQAINAAKTFEATIDVYIDESKFYVHRTQLVIDTAVDTSKLSTGSSTSSIPTGLINTKLNTTVDLSKFNEPVTLNVPTNATPTNDPAAIFGLNGMTTAK